MSNKPKTLKVQGSWKGKSAGGCINHPSWRFNPQLFISVSQRKKIKIELSQEERIHIGFYVFKSDGTTKRQLIIAKGALVGKGAFSAKEIVESEVQLEEGTQYVVIPCTFKPAMESKFTITFSCLGPLKIAPLPPAGEWKCVTGKGEWKGKTAGGCRNHPETCVNNPQYLIRTKRATKATIVVSQSMYKKFSQIGFYVLKTKASSHKLLKFKTDSVVGKSDFARPSEAAIQIQLEGKSKYAVVPCTFEPDFEAKFTLTIFTDNDVRLRELKDSREVVVESTWEKSEAGGSLDHVTWRNNPQFFLMMEKKALVSISLHQFESDYQDIGFYLARGQGNQAILLPEKDIIKKSEFKKERVVSVEVLLDPAEHPYVIMPCTRNPGIAMKFRLVVTVIPSKDPEAAKPLKATKVLNLVPCGIGWRKKFARGQWTQKFSGGNMNNDTWANNPLLQCELEEDSRVVLVLSQPARASPCGFYIFSSDAVNGQQLIPAAKNKLLHKSDFKLGVEVALDVNLKAGKYYVVLCTENPGVTTPFVLNYFAADCENIELNPVGEDQSFVRIKKGVAASMGNVKWEDITLIKKIGQGGFGVVHKGKLNTTGEIVAIKKVFSNDMEEAELDSFRKEVEIMHDLQHDNILRFIAASLDIHTFIVTEFMSRGNMSDCLAANPNLEWKVKLKMALDAAKGMKYLHARTPPVVHRDLKSLNLLVNDDFTVKVADFGISKATSGNSLNSKVGSLNWAAPEILLKRAPFTPQSDVYSYGMVLYELTTHEPPFTGFNPLQVVRAIDAGDLPKLPDDTDEDFVQLVEDCWKNEPDDRPPFDDICDRLTDMISKCDS